jgi:hypothetical protein
MGRRGRRKGSQGRAEGRVRGRVRESARGGRARQGERGGGSNKGGSFDVGDIQGYANRLTSGTRGGSGFPPAAASGLAGAASGLAGGSLAQRFLGGGSGGSDEDFRRELTEQLALMDERLQRLEDEMSALRGGGDAGDYAQGGNEPDPGRDR